VAVAGAGGKRCVFQRAGAPNNPSAALTSVFGQAPITRHAQPAPDHDPGRATPPRGTSGRGVTSTAPGASLPCPLVDFDGTPHPNPLPQGERECGLHFVGYNPPVDCNGRSSSTSPNPLPQGERECGLHLVGLRSASGL
jgi:hypothetical protein